MFRSTRSFLPERRASLVLDKTSPVLPSATQGSFLMTLTEERSTPRSPRQGALDDENPAEHPYRRS